MSARPIDLSAMRAPPSVTLKLLLSLLLSRIRCHYSLERPPLLAFRLLTPSSCSKAINRQQILYIIFYLSPCQSPLLWWLFNVLAIVSAIFLKHNSAYRLIVWDLILFLSSLCIYFAQFPFQNLYMPRILASCALYRAYAFCCYYPSFLAYLYGRICYFVCLLLAHHSCLLTDRFAEVIYIILLL